MNLAADILTPRYTRRWPRCAANVFGAGCDSPPAVWRASAEPASAFAARRRVSRSGEMPEPTVIVRMKEDDASHPSAPAAGKLCRIRAFIAPDSRTLSASRPRDVFLNPLFEDRFHERPHRYPFPARPRRA
ncbi:Riboflavin synthase [Chromobacterium vaccinii]|nr:Riboflavin synthase [Chromobacterium vaccinii]QND92438.1 Riboflavin synthase [Chromobacterium vaccinii]